MLAIYTTALLSSTSRSPFLGRHRYHPLPRPNITPLFELADISQPPLLNSPSPLQAEHWRHLLLPHGGDLGQNIFNILTYGAQIGYTGPQVHITSKNLNSASEAPNTITSQLQADLMLGRVSPCHNTFPFISSPLGLVPKSDGGWRRIHHLSHPPGRSVNDGIPTEFATLAYTQRVNLLNLVIFAGRGSILIKRDLEAAFRMVPVAPHCRWLLGFWWEGSFYHENCLPFGLRTAPFLFNIFAEALHWILTCLLTWLLLTHYLDDFIAVVPARCPQQVTIFEATWDSITDKLGLLQNTSKSAKGTRLECLGIEIDTVSMEARLSPAKLAKALNLVCQAIAAGTLTHNQCERLTGFLSFCTIVVKLGRTFLRPLWTFQSSYRNRGAARPLTPSAMAALVWWRDLLPSFNGVRLLDDPSRHSFHLFSDASDTGQGAFYYSAPLIQSDWKLALPLPQDQAFSAQWLLNQEKHVKSINTRELIAIATAISIWAPTWKRNTLVIHTDNNTALSGFLKGDVKATDSMNVLRDALLIAAAHNIDIHVKRVTSTDNTLADALSRLNQSLVANLCPHWQVPLPFYPSKTLCPGSLQSTQI